MIWENNILTWEEPLVRITLDGGTSIRMLHFLKKMEKKSEINKLSFQYFFQS